MRRNEATAFENEYFYDKKGNLKVCKVLKTHFSTGQRPRIGKKTVRVEDKSRSTKPKHYSDLPKRMWPSTSSDADLRTTAPRTRDYDFDNNDSGGDDNFDSDESDYDSQTEWNYGDSHNDAGNDW